MLNIYEELEGLRGHRDICKLIIGMFYFLILGTVGDFCHFLFITDLGYFSKYLMDNWILGPLFQGLIHRDTKPPFVQTFHKTHTDNEITVGFSFLFNSKMKKKVLC